MKKRIHLVVAIRPDFVKIAPLFHALAEESWAEPYIVHTGQHYDAEMSDVFFADLGLPGPHLLLNVGSGSHAEQTGRVMMAYEKGLETTHPELVVVVEDGNSALAAALAAAKLAVPVAHLGAGRRCFDRSVPEEVNQVVIDALAALLWTSSPEGGQNLLREGIPARRIEHVGSAAIDSLEMLRPRIEAADILQRLGLSARGYGIVTLHRPGNVDDPDTLAQLISDLGTTSETLPLVFPMHPRTRNNLEQFSLLPMLSVYGGLHPIEPLGYIQFMNLLLNCRLAVTDSGGVQEESTYLGIPCLTLRSATDRPVTLADGTNRLSRSGLLQEKISGILEEPMPAAVAPDLWDGKTALRLVASLRRFFL